MPRSVGPGGPRATAEPLDQVLMLIVLSVAHSADSYDQNLNGTCGNT